jgi:oligopeptide/dipeptide ABC transporter ATP-binding protein
MATLAPSTPLIDVRDLRVEYAQAAGRVIRAVDGLTVAVEPGRTLGIVGESGSGKTTVVRAILRIVDEPGRIAGGSVLYRGRDLLRLGDRELRRLRGNKISMIFQDPSGSLDPLHTVGEQFVETIRTHMKLSAGAARDRAREVLDLVGLPDPVGAMASYSSQLSAGTIQRMMIGMAIACEPDLILADEPTTGLGVLPQAQILSVLRDIQRRLGTTLILITHDMGVVAHVADEILVMYAGRCVEYGAKDQVLTRPTHPYTLGLMRSVPDIDGERPHRLRTISGFPPDLSALPRGCPFVSRCYRALPRCADVDPPLEDAGAGHMVACHSPVTDEDRRETPR